MTKNKEVFYLALLNVSLTVIGLAMLIFGGLIHIYVNVAGFVLCLLALFFGACAFGVQNDNY